MVVTKAVIKTDAFIAKSRHKVIPDEHW